MKTMFIFTLERNKLGERSQNVMISFHQREKLSQKKKDVRSIALCLSRRLKGERSKRNFNAFFSKTENRN
jgi:hypothetical protein